MVSFRSSSSLLWLSALTFLPVDAFVNDQGNNSVTRPRWCRNHPALSLLRGGEQTALPAVSDYSDTARVLFGNIVSPAALLAGSLVPLGFLAAPLPGDKPLHKKLRCIYHILSVLSLTSELVAITYGTIASNKLAETIVAPASSAFDLIQRDYELPWIGANVHFMVGLFGFVAMICLRAYTIFPPNLNRAAAGLAAAMLFGMFSIVNQGVSAGDMKGKAFGNSLMSLAGRYSILLIQQLKRNGGIMAMASGVLGLVSTIAAVHALLSPEESS